MALIVLAALLNPFIHRSKAWLSMCMIFAVFPLLYLVNLAWQYQLGKEPPHGMCMFQAALIYGGPPAACVSVLCYVMDVSLGLHSALFNKTKSAKWTARLLYIPSIVFAFVFCLSILLVSKPDEVAFEGSHMFCTAGLLSPSAKIAAGLIVATLLIMTGIKVWIVVMLVRNWSAFRSVGSSNKDLRISVFVRFGVFAVLIWVAGGLSAAIILTNKDTGAIWNILLVTVPFTAGITFGTHKNVFITYMYWIRGKPLSGMQEPGFYVPESTTGKD